MLEGIKYLINTEAASLIFFCQLLSAFITLVIVMKIRGFILKRKEVHNLVFSCMAAVIYIALSYLSSGYLGLDAKENTMTFIKACTNIPNGSYNQEKHRCEITVSNSGKTTTIAATRIEIINSGEE